MKTAALVLGGIPAAYEPLQTEKNIIMNVLAEIKSSTGQKAFATILCLPFVALALIFGMGMLFPDRNFLIEIRLNNSLQNWLILIACIHIIYQAWWRTLSYRTYVTSEGVGQIDGFRQVFVRWDQISSFSMELTKYGRRYSFKDPEPVLRDASGRVLLRPSCPPAPHTPHNMQERVRFWEYVINQLNYHRKVT